MLMVSFLLMRKIFQLFLILLLGFDIVRAGVLRASDSVILSRLSLYLISPCVIINAFQVEFTAGVRQGLVLALVVSAAIYVLFLVLGAVLKRGLHMDAVEEASVIYPNAANLIIPLVSGVLGPEWVIYTSAFISVQLCCLWSHGRRLFTADEPFELKKVVLNVNMLSIAAGALLLVLGVRLPAVLRETVTSVGDMIGPVSMLITGMLAAQMHPRRILANRRIWLVLSLRMLLCPALVLLLLRIFQPGARVPDGNTVLLVTFLATATPAANTVTQFAQLYGHDAEYAGAINILSTLLCLATMPLFVWLYGL